MIMYRRQCNRSKPIDGMTPLHHAARSGADAQIIRSLIADGADVHAKDHHGMTPLHWAAKCNPNVEVAKCLIEYGADVRAKDNNGDNPLYIAWQFAQSEEVGIYFLDIALGSKGVLVTDPLKLAEIKQRMMQTD